MTEIKTVVVLGAAYGGANASTVLAEMLPPGWRVIVIDRNTHFNHAYVLPRYAVVGGFEYKAFIRYDNLFRGHLGAGNKVIHANVLSITPHSVIVSHIDENHRVEEIQFAYAVYALGAVPSKPLDFWASPSYTGAKTQSVQWLKENHAKLDALENAAKVLVVGGGALGVQFATDIKNWHPHFDITLLHSRDRYLHIYNPELSQAVLEHVEKAGIHPILGERLNLSTLPANPEVPQRSVVYTLQGRRIESDYILVCTGQRPNTSLLYELDPKVLRPLDGLACVKETMQLDHIDSNNDIAAYPNIFAVGDAADAFGAIKAGHTAYYQAEVAVRNILRLIKGDDEPLEHYQHGPPGIKVTLGPKWAVSQVDGQVKVTDDGVLDLHAGVMWPGLGIKVEKEEDMYD